MVTGDGVPEDAILQNFCCYHRPAAIMTSVGSSRLSSARAYIDEIRNLASFEEDLKRRTKTNQDCCA